MNALFLLKAQGMSEAVVQELSNSDITDLGEESNTLLTKQ